VPIFNENESIAMTPTQIKLVQDSFLLVLPIEDTAADLFYQRLFELDPSLRPLFKGDLAQQKKMLMQTLSVAVRGLSKLDAVVPVLEHLGQRHVGYGVEDRHYETVGAALLWTLEKGLGAAYTAETAAAWTTVYELIAKVMRNAAAAESN
jgi:hemoglobin-like flavoprotein